MRNLCLILCALLLACPGAVAAEAAGRDVGVPILVYHRFGASGADAMTVKTAVFASHLEYLRAHGYVVIPLRQLVEYLQGRAPAPPEHAVVITADDGNESVFTDMFPLIVQYRIPVTLFIYPSAISRANYAMTWDQLRRMRDSGLVDIQSHTYWHPNFRVERKRRSANDYESFVHMQLTKSRELLEHRLGGRVNLLAWPFGLYDDELLRHAREAGYDAAVTLDGRAARRGDDLMALPRFLVTNAVRGRRFAELLGTKCHHSRKNSGGGGP